MDASITSTHIWSAAGAICLVLTSAISILYRTLLASQERREKALEDRSKDDRDRCASAYAEIATRLREIEDRAHKDSVTANREMVTALRESIQTNRELARCAGETVKAAGRCAKVVEIASELLGIKIQAKPDLSAARQDESSQEFILRDPVEKFTTARPGQAGAR